MSDHTGIQWTDATWNPIRGCARVSEGCRHCYAETVARRFSGPGLPYAGLVNAQGRWNGTIRVVEEHLADPLRWQRPRRVFVNSMSDLFHENVADETIDRIFAVMALADRHTFQVLTKRPERMRAYLSNENTVTRIEEQLWEMHTDDTTNAMPYDGVLRNVWLGVSVEDQATADARIPLLLQTPAAVRFISAEPLLGPVDLHSWLSRGSLCECGIHRGTKHGCQPASRDKWIRCNLGLRRLNWVIVGGESGPGARALRVEWLEAIVDQCRAAGVACFVKQLGAYPIWAGARELPIAAARGKCDNPDEWPAALRVRQFPAVSA